MKNRQTSGQQAVRAYQELKALLLRGELPPGAKLSHAQLGERLGMSSTPIREGLARLVQEGYAVQVPNVGFFVQGLETEEAAELYDAREALEVFAVSRLARSMAPDALEPVMEVLEQYAEEVRRPIRKERLICDREFHLAVARLAGNRWLERTLAAVFDRLIMKRTLDGLIAQRRGTDSLAEHREIVRLIEKGAPAKAAVAMRRHIHRGKTFVMDHLRAIEAMRQGPQVNAARPRARTRNA